VTSLLRLRCALQAGPGGRTPEELAIISRTVAEFPAGHRPADLGEEDLALGAQ
jgi:hypothetical protein